MPSACRVWKTLSNGVVQGGAGKASGQRVAGFIYRLRGCPANRFRNAWGLKSEPVSIDCKILTIGME